jgi:hypothetical protein
MSEIRGIFARVPVELADELEKARKAVGISRSAYVCIAIAEKIRRDSV